MSRCSSRYDLTFFDTLSGAGFSPLVGGGVSDAWRLWRKRDRKRGSDFVRKYGIRIVVRMKPRRRLRPGSRSVEDSTCRISQYSSPRVRALRRVVSERYRMSASVFVSRVYLWSIRAPVAGELLELATKAGIGG